MDNVDADILAAIYNRQHPPFVNAYIRGKKHKDLRYFVRTWVGAIPQLDSPEEVGLINYDPEGMDDGIACDEVLDHRRGVRDSREKAWFGRRNVFLRRGDNCRLMSGRR